MFRKSLSRILRTFEKAVADLATFDAQVTEDIGQAADKIDELEVRRKALVGDRTRARQIRENLSNLIRA